jgi:hypothetical protein
MIIIKQKEDNDEIKNREKTKKREKKIYICTKVQKREREDLLVLFYMRMRKSKLSIAIVSHLFIGTTRSQTRDAHRFFFLLFFFRNQTTPLAHHHYRLTGTRYTTARYFHIYKEKEKHVYSKNKRKQHTDLIEK